jgi:hypothetical protein
MIKPLITDEEIKKIFRENKILYSFCTVKVVKGKVVEYITLRMEDLKKLIAKL